MAKPLSPGGLPSGAGGLPDSAHCCRCAPRWALPPGRETEGWYGLPRCNLDLLQLLLPSCSCHSSFPLWKCSLAAPSRSLLGGWALSIRFSECFWARFRASFCVPDTHTLCSAVLCLGQGNQGRAFAYFQSSSPCLHHPDPSGRDGKDCSHL